MLGLVLTNGHTKCQEEERLHDAYFMALSRGDSIRRAARSGEVTGREVACAHTQLVAARIKYWAHVQLHNCRRKPPR